MIVLVPYADGRLHPRVVPAIERQGYTPMVWRCENIVGSPNSYPLILSTMLLGMEDVCVIEHDVESRPGFLDDLAACPEPWCFFAYDFSIPFEDAIARSAEGIGAAAEHFAPLGHTRFRAGACEVIRDVLTADVFTATWVARDTWITAGMLRAGIKPHRHAGKAIHHHDYPSDS